MMHPGIKLRLGGFAEQRVEGGQTRLNSFIATKHKEHTVLTTHKKRLYIIAYQRKKKNDKIFGSELLLNNILFVQKISIFMHPHECTWKSLEVGKDSL